jgi:hypothetical protein
MSGFEIISPHPQCNLSNDAYSGRIGGRGGRQTLGVIRADRGNFWHEFAPFPRPELGRRQGPVRGAFDGHGDACPCTGVQMQNAPAARPEKPSWFVPGKALLRASASCAPVPRQASCS